MNVSKWAIGRSFRLGAMLLCGLVPAAAEAAGAASEPVGIALEVENGEGVPVELIAGRTYYINQLDMRAAVASVVDSGVDDLAYEGDFADLPWYGVRMVEHEVNGLANADGTWTDRRFFRNALWMELPSFFIVQQVDRWGLPVLALPVILNAGMDNLNTSADDFFIRRFRAIQWVYDCPAFDDCTGARNFEAEALVELRNVRGKPSTFKLHPRTAAFQIIWSLKPWAPYYVPVRQVEKPQWDYGFRIDVEPITRPRANGTYAPGDEITFRITLRDGKGNRLHPVGELPTFADASFGNSPAGIRYYGAFFDPTATYWRRKHRERMLMAQIIGPAQHIQPLRTVAALEQFLVPGSQVVATPERDGAFSEFAIIPEAEKVFGGAFEPDLAGWFEPVSDEFTFHIPENAAPGTYLVTVKGRRFYMGEDLPHSVTIEIQVGQTKRTVPHLTTGNCQNCHNNGGEFSKILHANDNLAACNGCHVPLAFELEGPIFVRTHFIHSRSDRVDNARLKRCTTCHLEQETTQRVSKAACLSCHKSYPSWHEEQFGHLHSMYVGGGAESFVTCTDSCHRNHPGSGF